MRRQARKTELQRVQFIYLRYVKKRVGGSTHPGYHLTQKEIKRKGEHCAHPLPGMQVQSVEPVNRWVLVFHGWLIGLPE